ncbi:hypothetical protein OPKNFCMD_2227 [Methylobacterium crusticola]|uniref:Uncharacterized protein n=1 Tax=Methylobacterium crusticola TaxID=1697972 RepID=A0ABQ4QWR5_9HYPH|nr:hypothetical protein [Methylobacterium crusticola]GJD49496.1 hypothetical protein OPKNFCMD_2227 [Methylobacterium crusticola]
MFGPARTIRPALAAGLLTLALAAQAAADGLPGGHPAPGDPRLGGPPSGDEPRAIRALWHGPVVRRAHAGRGRPVGRGRLVGRVQPVSWGETDGEAYEAWMPRPTGLPIYNIPPPVFPAW